MTFTIGPFSVTLIQLLMLAIGVAWFLGIFQAMAWNWFSRLVSVLMGLPVLLIFIFIAFFKISELTLVPFIAKIVSTYFLDSSVKYQVNFPKDSKADMTIKRQKYRVQEQVVKKNKERIEQKGLDKISSSWLL